MEPIRPDSDEVAARKNEARRAAPRQPATAGAVSPGAGAGPGGAGGGRGGPQGPASRPSKLPLLLLFLVVLGAGWMLFQQQQAIAQLQSNLGEAEDWVNRSKLSMARFEGRLSEADRELLESGSEITEKLAFLDSEMRKLWGVANDRNRKAIAANKEATDFLEKKTDYLDKQGAEQRQLLATRTEELEALEEQTATLEQQTTALAEAATGLEESLTGIAEQQQDLARRVEANAESTQGLETAQNQFQQQLNSLNQRQTLSLDEVRARVDAMEKRVAAAGDQSELRELQNRFSSLKEVVDSIDASRAQITGRLLQLEQRMQAANGG